VDRYLTKSFEANGLIARKCKEKVAVSIVRNAMTNREHGMMQIIFEIQSTSIKNSETIWKFGTTALYVERTIIIYDCNLFYTISRIRSYIPILLKMESNMIQII
jgi:hypothetical protein